MTSPDLASQLMVQYYIMLKLNAIAFNMQSPICILSINHPIYPCVSIAIQICFPYTVMMHMAMWGLPYSIIHSHTVFAH